MATLKTKTRYRLIIFGEETTMATNFELQAEKREQFGTADSRRLRRENGRVPAIVYGAGKSPQPVTLNHNEVIVALGHETFYSNIVQLTIGEHAEQVILKALQRHPYKNKVLHLDFMRVKANEKLTVKVPLRFVGQDKAPGVKEEGGVVTHHSNDLEVRCLPKHLPEFIEIDLSAMQLNAVMHLSDIALPSGVEIVALALGDDHNSSVASLHMPRIIEEEPPTEAAAVEGEEGETKAEGAEPAEADKTKAGDNKQTGANKSEGKGKGKDKGKDKGK